MKTIRLSISGKVQGVWFRASAKDKAIALGLTGKVWNESNGNVGIIVQGPVHKIQEFIEWCSKGPPLSKVDKVTANEVQEEGVFGEFRIVREGV